MRISDWSSDVGYSDLLYSSGIDWLPVFIEHRPDRWTAASAICARRESRSHGLNAGQLLVGNGLQYGPGPNVEAYADRKRVVQGKSVSVSVYPGGRRIIKKNTHNHLLRGKS